jgi:LemA protein
LRAWVEAERAMASPMARLSALVELQSDLAGVDVVQTSRKTLAEVGQRLGYARQLFNEAAQAYDTALGEFPTRLMTRVFGFRRVSPL